MQSNSFVDNDPAVLGKIDELWAKELYEINVHEREVINDELHGVSVSFHPNPEQNWTEKQYDYYMRMFQAEIDTNIPTEDKEAYKLGLDLGSSYIVSLEFRFRFIRAEQYDIQNAAIRYCNCLSFLFEVFGEKSLLRPLLINDLTKNEMKFLKEGYIQILPSRDRIGRRILAQLGSYGGSRYTEFEKFRVSIYLCFSVLSEDVTSQHRGVVSLGSFTIEAESFMWKELRVISKLIKRFFAAVPLRWSATHLCIPDDPVYHLVKSCTLFFLGKNGRRILRIHVGTPMECDYKLRCFGIPTEDIPRTCTHKIKLKNHNRLIVVRKAIDQFREQSMRPNDVVNMSFPGVECPEINCVLFGKCAYSYPGNIEFRGFLREIHTKHRKVDLENQGMIYDITQRVIEELPSQNFRFMMYDRNTLFYNEVTNYEEIWKLVELSVRDYRKRSRARAMTNEARLSISKIIDKSGSEDETGMNVTHRSSCACLKGEYRSTAWDVSRKKR